LEALHIHQLTPKNLHRSIANSGKTIIGYGMLRRLTVKHMLYKFSWTMLISLGLILMSCSSSNAKTKEEIVNMYLSALTKMDKGVILSICAPNHEGVEKIVLEKLNKFGGHTFTSVNIEYAEEINPAYARAIINAQYRIDNLDYLAEEELFLQNIDGNWYVVFGKYKDNPVDNVATIQP
jgi:hypothetical protein